MIVYHKPEHVLPLQSDPPLVSTPQNGKIVLDETLFNLWQFADGKSLRYILKNFHSENATNYYIRSALACLAEAGLLERSFPIEQSEPIVVQSGKLVSVVILVFDGIDWLAGCLDSILRQTYSPIEIIIVDNASTKPCREWVKEHYSTIDVYYLPKPIAIPAANNYGVSKARGEIYLLLNQDTLLEPDAIAEMVSVLQSDPNCVAVAPKLKLLWAPAFLNGLGNRVEPYSWGTDNGFGHLDLGQFAGWTDLPSVCTAAALFSKEGWESVGQMDESFPMYYDDPEWSYRARLFGYRILAATKAIVYHAFGGRIPSGEIERLSPKKIENIVYGRLHFVLKLLNESRSVFLRNYLLEDWANFSYAVARFDFPTAGSYIKAELRTLINLLDLPTKRHVVQARRKITDPALFQIQKGYPPALEWRGLPRLDWNLIVTYYYLLMRMGETRPMPEFTQDSKRISLLIVSNDVIDAKMGGPGIRYLEMARTLSGEFDVTLAIPSPTSLQIPGLHIVRYWEDRPASLQVLVENHEIALISGYMPLKFPFLAQTKTYIVVDLYDPFFLENLYYYLDQPIESQEHLNYQAIDVTNRLARIGDFFICGNERQRDFWLGLLSASARVNPKTFSLDPSLRKTIDVVGIGFPDRQPKSHPVLRGVNSAFQNDSKIVLWGGGIWNWLDPLTLVKAWPRVIQRHPEARLVFLGTRYPNPLVPEHKITAETINLAEKIGEKDKSIFFIEWLSYEDHEALLCEADIGVTLQPDHVETRFSIRTRVVNYFWTQLPVLVSDGDITADWVRQYKIGYVVKTGDSEDVASSLIEMLDKSKSDWSDNFAALRADFLWTNTLIPLRQYCLNPYYAPDRQIRTPLQSQIATVPATRRNPITHALKILNEEGVVSLVRRSVRHLIWLIERS